MAPRATYNDASKTCGGCGVERPMTDFHLVRKGRPHRQSRCKDCSNASVRKHWRDNPAARESHDRKYHLRTRYGMSVEDYERMLASQDGKCAICFTDSPGAQWKYFAVDHDHACCPGQKSCGSCVRQLLCASCNRELSVLESPEKMRRLLGYLLHHDPTAQHTHWYSDTLNQEMFGHGEGRVMVQSWDDSNLISSLNLDGTHSPRLDIDFKARLIPSSTPDHYHLYLDGLKLDWDAYATLLTAMAEAGVISRAYLRHTLKRQHTMLRRPGVPKIHFDIDFSSADPDPETGVDYRVDLDQVAFERQFVDGAL